MKKLNLFMAILMALVTTCIILMILFFVEESNLGWSILILTSIVGYLYSALYYHNYKNSKDIG
jgi:hypothetical protein